MFRPFLNRPSSGWNTMSEELYIYYNTIISVTVTLLTDTNDCIIVGI